MSNGLGDCSLALVCLPRGTRAVVYMDHTRYIYIYNGMPIDTVSSFIIDIYLLGLWGEMKSGMVLPGENMLNAASNLHQRPRCWHKPVTNKYNQT